MNPPFRLRRIAVGVLAAAACTGSWALGLGRAQGIALVGRPLDITVPVSVDAGEAPPECFSADVFYGDTRLREERVAVEFNGRAIRVRASVPIDEPVVTLHVQMGCGNRIGRRIVLLTEQPDLSGEPPRAIPPRPLAQSPVETLPVVPAAPAAGSTGQPGAPGRGGAARVPGGAPGAAPGGAESPALGAPRPVRPRAAAPAAESPAARPIAPAGPRRAAVPAAPRLKLEPLDLSVPIEPTLRSTGMLELPATEATAQQRAAAQALWKALNAQPEDLLREAQRLESLESDLKALRQSVQRNDKALADLRGQLQEAQAERYANPLVYTLAALLAASLGLAGWAWRRGGGSERASQPWWKPRPRTSREETGFDALDVPPPRTSTHSRRGASSRGVSVPSSRPGYAAVDLPLDEPRPASAPAADLAAQRTQQLRPAERSSFQTSGREDFPFSQPSQLRSLKAEELHDVQQEADFFVSLGEFDRAIEVLRAHIAANPQTSPVAWLDLVDIYHRLGRREDYAWVRDEFQRNFNAQVPEFDAYSEGGASLEQYENAMARIIALWPSRRVLDVIEESIFRGPAQDGAQAFSLQAYRELLLLHHVGTEVFGREARSASSGHSGFTDSGYGGGGGSRPGFGATAIHPLSTGTQARAPVAASAAPWTEPGLPPELAPPSSFGAPDLELPLVGGDAPLDINLDEPAAHLALPEVDEPLIGDSQASGAPASDAGQDSNMLDFDLPEIDTSSFTTKKTRE